MKKRIVMPIIVIVLTLLLTLTGCEEAEYAITGGISDVIAVGETPELSGLKLIRIEKNEILEIPVSADMVYGIDTSTAGNKTFSVIIEGKTFTVPYTVKYRVEFVADGEVIDTQLVFDPSELIAPDAPDKDGFKFVGFNIPEKLTDNIKLDAQYTPVASELPNVTATYGDTLADITLPSNGSGKWAFTSPLDTPVGDVGTSRFDVKFVLDDGSILETATVNIVVNKCKLEFENLVTEFVYDGKEHYPTFDAFDADISIYSAGSPATEVGEYSFMLVINDDNYEGEYIGTFAITKRPVTITVDSHSISYGDQIPAFGYTVLGCEGLDIDLMITMQDFSSFIGDVGTYDVGLTVGNENIDPTVNKGTLEIKRIHLDPGNPTAIVDAGVFYGDTLDQFGFTEHGSGEWSWQTPTDKVGAVGENTHIAVFTPFNENYESSTAEVKLTVYKKELTIEVTEHSYVYDGTEKGLVYVIKDSLGNVYDDIEGVVGDVRHTNAGSYELVISLSDSRYTAYAEHILTIEKAEPSAEFGQVIDTVWRPGLILSDIALPGGFAWSDPSETVASADLDGMYGVIFTPDDTDNYLVISGEFELVIDRADASISGALSEYTAEYNGFAYSISGIAASHLESSIQYEYYKDGVKYDSVTDVGVYDVVIILPATTNYNEARANTKIAVLPMENKDEVDTEQSAVFGDKLSSLVLPDGKNGTWSWKEGDVTVGHATADTPNSFTAVFTPSSENYAAREVTVNVTVAKKAVALPRLPDLVYMATEQTVTVKLIGIDESLYTLSGDLSVFAAGSYSVDITITSANHRWADGDGDTRTVSFNVSSAVVNIGGLAIEPWTYGGEVNLPTATVEGFDGAENDVEIIYTYEYKGTDGIFRAVTAPENAGEYRVKAAVRATADYVGSSETEYVYFTVARQVIDETLINIVNDSLVYNGERQYSGLISTDSYTVSDAGGIYANTASGYTVTLTVTSNYVWKNTDSSAVTLVYYIYKAENEILSTEIGGSVYGSVLTHSAVSKFGTPYIVYYTKSSDGVYTEISLPAYPGAGTYYAKAVADGTQDYAAAESDYIEFTVDKAVPEIKGLRDSYTAVYSGEAFRISGIYASYGGGSFTVLSADGKPIVNVGDYIGAQVILAETANYISVTYTTDIHITKKASTVDEIDILYAVYGDLLSSVMLPEVEGGTLAWQDGTVTVGNAGENLFTAIFTPTDSVNFENEEITVTVSVAKALLAVPELSEDTFTYTGNKVTSKELGLTENALYTYKILGGVNVNDENKVVFTLADSANYEWTETAERTFTINKQKVTVPVIANSQFTYNGVKLTVSDLGLAESDLYSITVNGGINVNDENTVTVSLNNTDNYEWASELPEYSFTIAKATLEVPALGNDTFTYTGNKVTSKELGLTENALYTYEILGGVNVNDESKVVFTLTDTASVNYEWAETAERTFVIEKQKVTVPTLANDTFTYTGAKVTLAELGISENGVYLAVVNGGVSTDDENTVTLILKNAANYEWETEPNLAFTIEPKPAQTPGVFTSTFGNTLDTVTLPEIFDGEVKVGYWKWQTPSDKVGTAGTHTHTAVFVSESVNFIDGTAFDVTVNVDKFTVTSPVAQNFKYDGLEHTQTVSELVASLIDSGVITVEGTAAATNVGTYKLTYTLTDTDNYIWSTTLTEAAVVVEYKITTEVPNEWQTAPVITDKYGTPVTDKIIYGTEYILTAVPKYGDADSISVKYIDITTGLVLDSAPTAVGKYMVEVTTTDTNHTALTAQVNLEIDYFTVTAPVFAQSFTYKNGAIDTSVFDTAYYTFSDSRNGAVTVGDYRITLVLKDVNYKWSDTLNVSDDGMTKTYDYSIVKAQVTLTDLAISGWTYSDNADTPSVTLGGFDGIAELYDGIVSFVYSEDGVTYTAAVPTEAGEYFVKAIADDDADGNYNGTESAAVKFEIAKKSASVTGVTDGSVTYSGNAYDMNAYLAALTASYGAEDGGSPKFTYTVNGAADGAIIDTGRYEIKITLTDENGNYETVSENAVITVAKAYIDTSSLGSIDAVYGDTLADVSITIGASFGGNAVKGTWAWVSPNESVGTATESGRAFEAVFTPNDGNFEVTYAVITVKVAKLGIDAPTPTVTEFTFKNSAFTVEDFVLVGADGLDTIYKASIVGDTFVNGEHTLTFTLEDSDNYEWNGQNSYTFTIAKASLEVPALGNDTFTYTGNKVTSKELGLAESSLYSITVNGGINVNDENKVVFTLTDSDNYEWTETAERKFTINRATVSITGHAFADGITAWKYDGTEHALATGNSLGIDGIVKFRYFGAGVTDDSVQPTAIGSYTVQAYIEETDNYYGVDGDEFLPFSIEKADGYIIVPDTAIEVEYTGLKSDIEAAIRAAVTASGTLTLSEITGTDVGTYRVTLTSAESATHLSAASAVDVEITPAENTDTIPDTVLSQTVAYGTPISSLLLPANADNTGVWKVDTAEAKVGNAGTTTTYTLKFTPSAQYASNYAERTVDINVTVTKARVDVPAAAEALRIYDAVTAWKAWPQGLSSELLALYTVTDDGNIGAGTYTATLTLTDPENYEWADGTAGAAASVPYTVSKAADKWITEPTVTGGTFGDSVLITVSGQLGLAPAGETGYTVYYKLKGSSAEFSTELPVNAGTYIAKLTATNIANINNCDALTREIEFTIAKKSLGIGSLTLSASEFTYSEDGYTFDVQGIPAGVTYELIPSANTVGTGKVLTVKMSGDSLTNYKWNDTDTTSALTLTYTVKPGTAVIESLTLESWQYGAAPNTPSAAASMGTVKYTYLIGGTWYDAVPAGTDAGTYTVRATVDSTDNFTGTYLDASFEITKAEGTFSFDIDLTAGPYYLNQMNFQELTKVTYSNGVYQKGAYDSTDTIKGTLTVTAVMATDGTSTLTATFTPDASVTKNYASASISTALNLKVVATRGYGGDKYPSIEAALAGASSCEVWVAADKLIRIESDITIPAGVKLILPWGANQADKNSGGEATLTTSTGSGSFTGNNDAKCVTSVTVAAGKKITVNGTLEIAGQLSGGAGGQAYSGHLAGNYGRIVLESGSGIDVRSGGLINAYGVITESAKNNGSYVTVNNGATLAQPFVMRDFKGGSVMYAIQKDFSSKKSAPFNQFTFMNVQPELTIKYGGVMNAFCNLYASSKQNYTLSNIVGKLGDASFIQLSDATHSKLVAKFDKDTHITKLNIYGGANANEMSLSVNAGVTVTVSSKDFVFGISWLWDITLDNADGQDLAQYTLETDYKILPGGSLTVEQGAKLTAKTLTVYKSGTDAAAGQYKDLLVQCTYPSGKADGVLIVNGQLTAANLGGDVLAYADGAVVTVTSAVNVSTHEATATSGSSLMAKVSSWQTIVAALNLYYVQGDGTRTACDPSVLAAGKTLKTVNGAWIIPTTCPGCDSETVHTQCGDCKMYSCESAYICDDCGNHNCSAGTTKHNQCSGCGELMCVSTDKTHATYDCGNHWQCKDTGSHGKCNCGKSYKCDTQGDTDHSKCESCITPDTLITLADGSQVMVKDLKGDELLLVWNLFTGTYDTAPILFIDSDPEKIYEVIYLTFSDGTVVKVISEHGFFDLDLRSYVYLDRNAADYIGHSFDKSGTAIQLVDVEIREEYTTAWSPVTYGHLCYYVNGMLSMPGGIDGMFNIFEVDEDTMKYNEESMQADIEQYGLFTYEEFAAEVPVPEIMFEALGGQYLKVAIGKGLTTVEELQRLAARYSVFFE